MMFAEFDIDKKGYVSFYDFEPQHFRLLRRFRTATTKKYGCFPPSYDQWSKNTPVLKLQKFADLCERSGLPESELHDTVPILFRLFDFHRYGYLQDDSFSEFAMKEIYGDKYEYLFIRPVWAIFKIVASTGFSFQKANDI